MKSVPRLGSCILAVLLGGCPGAPRQVVYDLAARASAAERWSSREVVLFGTPAAEPYLADGFYREAPGASGDAFVWSKAEVRGGVSHRADRAAPGRARPRPLPGSAGTGRRGAPERRVRGPLRAQRHPPPLSPRPSLRRRSAPATTACASASPPPPPPPAADPKSTDKRELAAAFYAMVLGEEGDVALEDLLTPDAPRPFEAGEGAKGAPAPDPRRSEHRALRHPGTRGRGAPLHPVTAPGSAGRGRRGDLPRALPGSERGRARAVEPRASGSRRQGRGADGAAARRRRRHPAPRPRRGARDHDFRPLRLGGLHGTPSVGPWGRREPASGTAARPPKKHGADPLRKSLAGSNVVLVILDAARARSFSAYGCARRDDAADRRPRPRRRALRAGLHPGRVHPGRDVLGLDVAVPRPPPQRGVVLGAPAEEPADPGRDAHGPRRAHRGLRGQRRRGFGLRLRPRLLRVPRGLPGSGQPRRRLPPGPSRVAPQEQGPALLLLRALPRAPFPLRPRAALRHALRPRRPHPESGAPRPGLDHRRQPGRAGRSRRRSASTSCASTTATWPSPTRRWGPSCARSGPPALADKTLVIVAADHGEGLFEHGWIGHNVQLFEESVHVPLVVRFPSGKGP